MLKLLGVAALYALLARVVLIYFSANGVVSVIWPPSGLALAVLLIGGKRYAWGVFLGALLANALAGGVTLGMAAAIATGNTLEAFLGAWLLTRNGRFDPTLRSLRDYLRLIVLAGFFGVSVSALIGTTTLLVSGFITAETYSHNLLHWWMGDALGIMLTTPLILVWWQIQNVRLDAKQALEAIFVIGLTFLVGQVVFLGWLQGTVGQVAKGYWMYLLVTWAAVRLGTHGVVIVLIMTAVQALLGAYYGTGFFADDIVKTQLTNYWFYMVILSMVGMALATHFTERKQLETMLRNRTDELALHNQVLQHISLGMPLPKVLDELARQVEALRLGMLCSILLLDEDGKHLRHGAAPGLPDFYNQAINGLAIGDGMGACGTAAYRGERVIVEDVQQHAYWPEPYRDLARRAGVQSCWSQPIKDSNGRVLGTFAIYHQKPALPSDTEIALIERYADFTALAIERIRIQTALRESEASMRAILDNSPYLVWLKDTEGRYIKVNKGYADYIRLKDTRQVIGKTDFDLWPNELAEKYRADDAEVMATLQQKYVEEQSLDGGRVHWVETFKTPILDENGNVLGTTGFAHDITGRKQAEEKIYHLAFYDLLTGLPNRRLLNDRLGQTLAASKRGGRYGALMFMDLDNFKPLNDTHGHGVGDLLLMEVARRITSCVREVDTVARFGGDEFVVILSELDADKTESLAQAGIVAEKIRAILAKPYVLTVQQEGKAETITVEHHCTSSIGVVLFISYESSAEDILKWADMAMYQAKEGGRNLIRFFDS